MQNQKLIPCSDDTMNGWSVCRRRLHLPIEQDPHAENSAVTWSPVCVLLSLKLCRSPPSSCQPSRHSLLWNESRVGRSFPLGTRAAFGSCRPGQSDGWISHGRTSGKAVKLREIKHQGLWNFSLVLKPRILSDRDFPLLTPHGQKSDIM